MAIENGVTALNRSRKIGIVIAVMVMSAILAALITWKPWNSGPTWTEEEAIGAVLAQYSGEITDATLKGSLYYIRLKSAKGNYEVVVDGHNGSLQSVKRDGGNTNSNGDPLTTADPSPTIMPKPSATPKPTGSETSATNKPATEKPSLLTAAEAGKLASKHLASSHVKGVIEKVERGSGDDYLVEIEVDDGREATVQVNAISGEIMSVYWDDEDSDDKDDDI